MASGRDDNIELWTDRCEVYLWGSHGSLWVTGPSWKCCFHAEILSPQHLLEGQRGRTQAIQEVFGELSKNNFRLQVLDEPKKRRFSVEPATHEWFGTRKVSGSFGCCDHKMMVFKVLREVRQASGRILVVIRRTEPDHPGDVQKRTRRNGSIQISKLNVTLKLAVLWVGSWTNDMQISPL